MKDDGKSKIVEMPKPSSSEFIQDMKKAIRQLKEGLELQFEFQELIAKLLRSRFEALIKEGFTEPQALEISKTRDLFR